MFASVLFAVPPMAGAQSGGLEVELPANTDCRGAAVIAKTTVVEDAAAANMLAEALNVLSGGARRCLLDAGLPPDRRRPSVRAVPPNAVHRSSAGLASTVYVVGGPSAVPDAWLADEFGVNRFVRVAGADRWQTQESVAAAILALANGAAVRPYDPASVAAATLALPPNSGCHGTAVLAKLTIAEERAAANMLAAALTAISGDPNSRCLVDVGDPGADSPPTAVAVSEAARASGAFLLGGAAAVPQAWIDNGFDIRFVERISGPDRWATQAGVAETIVGIARGDTLPHQYIDGDDDLISIYGHQIVNETDFDGSGFVSSGSHQIKVHYCSSAAFLQGNGGTHSAAEAVGYVTEEVAELNRVVAPFFRHQSGGTLRIEFVTGHLFSRTHDEDRWSRSAFGDFEQDNAADDCLEAAGEVEPGYVLIDQPLGGTLGFAYMSGAPLAIQPIRAHFSQKAAGEFETTVAHEIGHAWLGLCHPHDPAGIARCRHGHAERAHEPALAALHSANPEGRYRTDQLELCTLMSYCYEDNGLLTDYQPDSGGPPWIACGQRALMDWPDGPSTPYGPCVNGRLELTEIRPAASRSHDTAWQPIIKVKVQWDKKSDKPMAVVEWSSYRNKDEKRNELECTVNPGETQPIFQGRLVIDKHIDDFFDDGTSTPWKELDYDEEDEKWGRTTGRLKHGKLYRWLRLS